VACVVFAHLATCRAREGCDKTNGLLLVAVLLTAAHAIHQAYRDCAPGVPRCLTVPSSASVARACTSPVTSTRISSPPDNAYSLLADLSLSSALGLLILTSFAWISAVSTASRQPHHAAHALFFTTLL
jgi:hypothetical protein